MTRLIFGLFLVAAALCSCGRFDDAKPGGQEKKVEITRPEPPAKATVVNDLGPSYQPPEPVPAQGYRLQVHTSTGGTAERSSPNPIQPPR